MPSWRDPTSLFFRENEAYEPSYSSPRAVEGMALINEANNVTETPRPKASANPTMCVGFASIAREGVSYFQSAVGSVLAGLSPVERADLFLILFIAHTDPTQHPAYSEPWLHELADKVLLYDEKDVDIDHIRSLETTEAKTLALEKGLLDYTYLLKACAAIGTPYTVMLEDDIIALDGWYHRTKQALRAVERQTAEKKASKLSWYESKGIGYVDMLTEDYANQNGEIRWALTPSVLQHVGSKSSKTNNPIPQKGLRTIPETLWNFGFEKNDVNILRKEHEQQIRWGDP
ncbi:hypothetical protein APSETT445_000103 [Aspergillus pseudonomiae]